MLFADFREPSTLAVLMVEAALFGLAFAAAFRGVLVRPVRWLARGLAAMTLVLRLGFAAGMVLELSTSHLPLVLPDAPLGTYANMTQLGLLVSIAQFGLIAMGPRWRSAAQFSAACSWSSPASTVCWMK